MVYVLQLAFPAQAPTLGSHSTPPAEMLRTLHPRGQFRQSIKPWAHRTKWLSIVAFAAGSDLRKRHLPLSLIYPRLQIMTPLCQTCRLIYREVVVCKAIAWNIPTHIMLSIHPIL